MLSQTITKKEKGFTIIEMIVSLGIFAFVITMAVGALLSMIANNHRLQAEQSAMSNLTFALDSMTREIRTGYSYVCGYNNNLNSPVDPPSVGQIFRDGDPDLANMSSTTVRDCITAEATSSHPVRGIAFVEGGGSITGASTNRRILYYFDHGAATIKRRVDNTDAQSIISSGLVVEDMKIYVTGSETARVVPANMEQPTVTIFIQAKEKDEDKRYYLQTTVTQRVLDL